jgi:hypothetical protein
MTPLQRLLTRLALTPAAAALTAALCVALFGLVEGGNPLVVTGHVAAITLAGLLIVTLPASYLVPAGKRWLHLAALTLLGALAAGGAAILADAPEKLWLPAAFCGGFGSLSWSSAALWLERRRTAAAARAG